MKLRVAYLKRAQADLLEIVAYIRRDSPAAGDRWLQQVDRSLSRLSAFPRSGAVPKDRRLAAKGYRVVVVGDYLAFYLIKGRAGQHGSPYRD